VRLRTAIRAAVAEAPNVIQTGNHESGEKSCRLPAYSALNGEPHHRRGEEVEEHADHNQVAEQH
jgi:hypothetical protein